ncbi:MAG: alpha/beta fold hydrolase [Betaproteobacteria bacterium]
MTRDPAPGAPRGVAACDVRDVVLLHGLWMPGLVMRPLASKLAARGYRPHVFDYASRRRPIEAHADRLVRFVRACARGPVYFVGHSFGGLVVLDTLARPDTPATTGVVLLGTPVRGCMAGRRLARAAPGRWMLGESRPLWEEGRAVRWDGRAPLGVIAGSRPTIGLGRLLGRLPGTNDGVVRLEETPVEGMTGRVVLPVGHTELIFAARVETHIAHFLAHGRFQYDADGA